MDRAAKEVERRKRILDHANATENVAKTCRYFGIARASFYRWREEYSKHGVDGLVPKRTGPRFHPNQTPAAVVEKVLHLRRTYHLGPMRIVWYLARYHDIKISDAGVYRILRRNGIGRLPGKVGRRAVHTSRYEKKVPGHHIQVDVKFLTFKDKNGAMVKRFQYTAIDDATRIRALKIYKRHNQANAIDFVDYVLKKFPFRIQMIRTDRGHEFQAKFHWHVEDHGIRHVYIKPRSPQLNGKVERSHRSDQEEFYQLLNYKDDVDLEKKLTEWERFYNLSRPHGAHKGKTPYEALRERL
jgi:transposase InsO family protein